MFYPYLKPLIISQLLLIRVIVRACGVVTGGVSKSEEMRKG